jgi:hypothetical protein
MVMRRFALAFTLWTSLAASAAAQDSDQAGPIPITGNAPTFCTVGGLQGADNVFDLGILADTSTGLLLPSLSAPPKTMTGAFCNTGSTISISATPIEAQTVNGAPPSGYSDEIDFTATASGWTTSPAMFSTGAGANPQASQTRGTPFAGDIVVSIGDFETAGGSTLRMRADPEYRGSITLTLTTMN